MSRQRRPSGDQRWNSQPPFGRPPPPFSTLPPLLPGLSTWSSAPPHQFCRPPQFGSHPPFPQPNFSVPPPNFSGPPPPSCYRNQLPHNTANPNSGSGAGQCGGKRPVNNVWSDPNLLQRTFDGPKNRNGHQHPNRGRQGGRGAGGRGRGRDNFQFQQGQNNSNNPWSGSGQYGGKHPMNNNMKNNNMNKNYNHQVNNNNNNNNNSNSNNNSNNQYKGGKKKKKKADKRNLPENNQYHCEVCDRGFKHEDKYQEHISQHTQCSVEGCRYVGAPKLVELHFFAQHKTGVAKTIWCDTPEEIKKWIADRKRNYPTKENIARKKKERAEKRARGELIENSQFGKMRGRSRGRGRGRGGYHPNRGRGGRGRGRGGRRWEPWNDFIEDDFEESPAQTEHNTHTEDDEQTPGSSPLADGVKGAGASSQEDSESQPKAKKRKLENDGGENSVKEKGGDSRDPLSVLVSEDSDSDSDSDSSNGDDTTPPDQTQGDGLTSLMAAYNSTKEDGEVTSCEEDASEDPPSKPQTSQNNAQKEEDKRSNEKPAKAVKSPVRRRAKEPAWLRHNRRQWHQRHRRNIMLERLLADEIRHERNVLLQCVHYIVNNFFLGVMDKKTDSADK